MLSMVAYVHWMVNSAPLYCSKWVDREAHKVVVRDRHLDGEWSSQPYQQQGQPCQRSRLERLDCYFPDLTS